MQVIVDKMKFEENKMYNLINRKNLEHLIRYTCRKMKKSKLYLLIEEGDQLNICQKLSKNWRSRKKKPPDKEIKINMSILSLKEFNLLRRKAKMRKEQKRKELKEVKIKNREFNKKVIKEFEQDKI
jgi:hypothetical protein